MTQAQSQPPVQTEPKPSAAKTSESLAGALAGALEHVLGGYLDQEAAIDPVAPVRLGEAKSIDLAIPTHGLGNSAAIDRLRAVVEATPTTSGPRFLNQLFAGREDVATIAEMVAAVLNTSMYTYKAAGPQTLVEAEVMRRMLELADMQGGDGMFAPGGSLSNLAAMVIGRNEVSGDGRDKGVDGTRCTLYVSAEGHYSINKNANMIGIGRDNVRPVPADELGRMDPAAAREIILADRDAGLIPTLLVATSGTTVRGAFDPIDPLADLRDEFGMWLHVDGAYGGSALIHPEHRKLMEGIGRADSLTWDAHKMMGVPMACSVVLSRHPAIMQTHFCEDATYLFQHDRSDNAEADYSVDAFGEAWQNPGLRSIQCGRRNDALKLWAQWIALGDEGYAARLQKQVDLAVYAEQCVARNPAFTLAAPRTWTNICFEVAGKRTDAIVRELDRTGLLKVSSSIIGGRRIIRLVTINPEHTEADIDRIFDDILAVAETAPDGDNAVG